MKKLLTFILIISTLGLFSQSNFQGVAIYKEMRKWDFDMDKKFANKPGMKKLVEEKMRKMYQKTYILNFTRAESTYKIKPKLNQVSPQANKWNAYMWAYGSGGANDLLYKNIKEQRFSNKIELMGKPFLIKDDLENKPWEMTGKTKSIGRYTVYQALWTRQEEIADVTMVDGAVKENKQKKTMTSIVWYTPDIPVSNGPENYWGLPGLILEVNDGNKTIVCTEIVLNPIEKTDITEPKKGKVVSQKKFEKISLSKTKEMMQRLKGGRGGKF